MLKNYKAVLSFVIFTVLLLVTSISVEAKRACTDPNKFPVCHAGSEKNPNYVNICVDFAALWGHFANHELDYYGECQTKDADIIAYTCNAGLNFSPGQQQICRDLTTNTVVSNCSESKNCVCSNDPYTEAQYQSNYFKFLIAPFFEGDQFYLDEFDFETLGYTEYLTLGGYNQTAEAALAVGKYILEPNSTLQFHFGSERFGNTYFVDTCFRYVGDLPTNAKISIRHQNTIVSENNSLYRQKAQLKQKYELFCDHSTSSTTNYTVSNTPLASTVFTNYNGSGLNWTQVLPAKKFCYIRTTLAENPLVTDLRPQSLQVVTYQNQTEVNLENYTPGTSDLPVNICYIENRTGCCTDVAIDTQEEFRSFIVGTGNTGQRNSSFRGLCPKNCKKLCK